MKIQFNAPINSLSLGNVSFNFLRELIKKDKISTFFPERSQFDFSSFDEIDNSLLEEIQALTSKNLRRLDRKTPVLKLWHINGSEWKLADKQYLYTFYETDSPTLEEISLVENQEAVIFSNSEARDVFKKAGCENVYYVPLGFDRDFKIKKLPKLNKEVIHFGLIGKLEKRKNTQRIIQLWLKKYGNNPKYQLTCLVNNPFFQQEIYSQIINATLMGKHWNNINFLNRLETNSEVNHLMNAIDIDLSGLSSGEGWNLPSFNATALGKWSVVSNCSAHKDWATKENSVLVEVEKEKEDCYDGVFFQKGAPFNQGKFYKISDEAIISGIEEAEKLAKTSNSKGIELQNKFTYEKSIEQILELIK